MKVGDLVELSSYGRKLKMFKHVRHGDVGLVYEKDKYYFRVRWCNPPRKGVYLRYTRYTRRDLKYAKKKNT